MPIPIHNWFGIGRQRLDISQHSLPINRPHNNRDHNRFLALMPFQGAFHLDPVAILRIHEVGADEQENYLGSIEVLTDLLFPFGACTNITIMPDSNQPLTLQRPQVSLELVEQVFIFMRITEEDFYCHEHHPVLVYCPLIYCQSLNCRRPSFRRVSILASNLVWLPCLTI